MRGRSRLSENLYRTWLRTALVAVGFIALGTPRARGEEYWIEDRACCHDPTPCVGTGTETNPFCRIQEGITYAQAHNGVGVVLEIWVKPGIYTEPTGNVVWSRGVQLKSTSGHSNPDGTPRTKINAWVWISPTSDQTPESILEGFWITALSDRAVKAEAEGDERIRVSNNKITGNSGPGIIAQGSGSVTISGNWIVGNVGSTSTGILVSGGSPQILDNIIEDNHPSASGHGGGITIKSGTETNPATPRISRTQLVGNTSPAGGGIYLSGWVGTSDETAATVIDKCVITSNRATANSGGGLGTNGARGSLKIANTVFRGNEAHFQGGGAHLQALPAGAEEEEEEEEEEQECMTDNCLSSLLRVKMQNCLFSCNKAYQSGAVHVPAAAHALMGNCTFVNNETVFRSGMISPERGGAILTGSGCSIIQNSIIWNNKNSPTGLGPNLAMRNCGGTIVYYSLLQGGCSGILDESGGGTYNCSPSGVFDADPLFACSLVGNCPCAAGTSYRHVRPSPAIDSGSNPLVLDDFADLDEDGLDAEVTPLDLDLNKRFIDDPYTEDTGPFGPPTVDMGAYELCPEEPPLPEPNGVPKARFISFMTPYTGVSAIRVRLVELYHPSEPPPRAEDFGPFEGQYRWVNSFKDDQGQPIFICPGKGPPFNHTYRCATLGCEPEYRDWEAAFSGGTNPASPQGLVHVTGSAIVPSSIYEVDQLLVACGQEGFEYFTAPVLLETTFWGDITSESFGPPDNIPNTLDLAAVEIFPNLVDGA